MSGPTPAKKRRIEAASTLSKPFRSPLKTATSKAPSSKSVVRSTPIKKSLLSTSHTANLPTLCTPDKNDPVLLAADAALKDLTISIAEIKAQIEILSQASSILSRSSSDSQSKNPDLRPADQSVTSLTQKWRSISQSAADTLYPTVEAKIASSGGLKAFYAQSQTSFNRTADGQSGFEEGEDWESADLAMEEEAEVDFDENGNQVGEAEKEMRRDQVRRARERRKAEMGGSGHGRGGTEGSNEDETTEFNMEVMLRTLHIDEKVIGWNRAEQRWV